MKSVMSVTMSVREPVWETLEPSRTITTEAINLQMVKDEEDEVMPKPKQRHDWYMCFPGNYCKRCYCDDPAEYCVGCCSKAPSDEHGYPNPALCPEHGVHNDDLWVCKG